MQELGAVRKALEAGGLDAPLSRLMRGDPAARRRRVAGAPAAGWSAAERCVVTGMISLLNMVGRALEEGRKASALLPASAGGRVAGAPPGTGKS